MFLCVHNVTNFSRNKTNNIKITILRILTRHDVAPADAPHAPPGRGGKLRVAVCRCEHVLCLGQQAGCTDRTAGPGAEMARASCMLDWWALHAVPPDRLDESPIS